MRRVLRWAFWPTVLGFVLVLVAVGAIQRERLRLAYWLQVLGTDVERRDEAVQALTSLSHGDRERVRASLLDLLEDADPQRRLGASVALARLLDLHDVTPARLGPAAFQRVFLVRAAAVVLPDGTLPQDPPQFFVTYLGPDLDEGSVLPLLLVDGSPEALAVLERERMESPDATCRGLAAQALELHARGGWPDPDDAIGASQLQARLDAVLSDADIPEFQWDEELAPLWLALARRAPERAVAWWLEHEPEPLEAILASDESPLRGFDPSELAALERALARSQPPGARAAAARELRLLCGASFDEEELAGRTGRSARVAGTLSRRRLDPAYVQRAARLRAWLRAHLAGEGRVGPRWVHPPKHPCALQGHGIERLVLHTPLTVLALAREPDADTLLAPSVRWLAAPAQDAFGLNVTEEGCFVPHLSLDDHAAIGQVGPAFEEALIVWALRRAREGGIEASLAGAALARRTQRLLRRLGDVDPDDPQFYEERGDLFLALSLLAERDPVAAEVARRLERGLHYVRAALFPATRYAARAWLVPDPVLRSIPGYRDVRPEDGGDPWLSTVGLRHAEAPTRRWWLWRTLRFLDDATDPERDVAGGACPGAIVRVGQEDPLILTAWTALAFEAVEEALKAE